MKLLALLMVGFALVAFSGCVTSTKTIVSIAGPGGPANLVVEQLRAGPVTMKFHNGELRYLQTGDGSGRNVEVIRRVYFAVRDQRFDTPMPVFDNITVVQNSDSFTADFTARVAQGNIEFAWTGHIEGRSDGTIVYTVSGQSGAEFGSPRIGLNVLLGTATYGGRSMDFTPLGGGGVKRETFPKSPTAWDPGRFQTFGSTPHGERRYSRAEFAATLSGREFGIEDQRQFGDSSYKAYGYLDLPFPNVPAGAKASQTLTLTFPNARPALKQPEKIRITLGEPFENKRKGLVPALHMTSEPAKTGDFSAARKASPVADVVTWGFNPALHLNDADMLFENTETIADQIAAVRANASKASVHISPITFQWPHPRPSPDPRAMDKTGAAWCAEMIRQLALAGADEATFQLSNKPWENPPAGDVLKTWMKHPGRYIVDYTTDSPGRCPVSVLAVHNTRQVRTVFLVNRSAQSQHVTFVQAVAKQASVAPIQLGNITWTAADKKGMTQSTVGAIRPDGRNVEAVVEPYAVVAFTLSNLEQ